PFGRCTWFSIDGDLSSVSVTEVLLERRLKREYFRGNGLVGWFFSREDVGTLDTIERCINVIILADCNHSLKCAVEPNALQTVLAHRISHDLIIRNQVLQ